MGSRNSRRRFVSDLAKAVGFVHLHVHSSYSLLEGALKIAQLAELAKADRQPALALTDTGNLFAALEFSEKMAGGGIQPIVGCALAVDFADEPPARNGAIARMPRIVLLAATEEGYRHLIALVSKSHLDVPAGAAPHVSLDWLKAHAPGLIALTGGPDGPLERAFASGHAELARKRLDFPTANSGDKTHFEF